MKNLKVKLAVFFGAFICLTALVFAATTKNWGTLGAGTTTLVNSSSLYPDIGSVTHTVKTTYSGTTNSASATYKYDPAPPRVAWEQRSVSADASSLQISFDDECYSDVWGSCSGSLSGVAGVKIQLLSASGLASPILNSSGTGASFDFGSLPDEFKKAGTYDVIWEAADSVGNTARGTAYDLVRVVAGEPVWSAGECSYVAGGNCPSTMSMTSGVKVADGEDAQTVTVKLVDKYGNPVVSESGVKQVEINYLVDNSVDLNQIAAEAGEAEESGDAARLKGVSLFDSGNSAFDQTGSSTGTTHLSETSWLHGSVQNAPGISGDRDGELVAGGGPKASPVSTANPFETPSSTGSGSSGSGSTCQPTMSGTGCSACPFGHQQGANNTTNEICSGATSYLGGTGTNNQGECACDGYDAARWATGATGRNPHSWTCNFSCP